MAVKLIYQMFTKMLSWLVLHTRSNTANEIEILVLRHQLAVLQRCTLSVEPSVWQARCPPQCAGLQLTPTCMLP